MLGNGTLCVTDSQVCTGPWASVGEGGTLPLTLFEGWRHNLNCPPSIFFVTVSHRHEHTDFGTHTLCSVADLGGRRTPLIFAGHPFFWAPRRRAPLFLPRLPFVSAPRRRTPLIFAAPAFIWVPSAALALVWAPRRSYMC
jgi:hypothetical protein